MNTLNYQSLVQKSFPKDGRTGCCSEEFLITQVLARVALHTACRQGVNTELLLEKTFLFDSFSEWTLCECWKMLDSVFSTVCFYGLWEILHLPKFLWDTHCLFSHFHLRLHTVCQHFVPFWCLFLAIICTWFMYTFTWYYLPKIFSFTSIILFSPHKNSYLLFSHFSN